MCHKTYRFISVSLILVILLAFSGCNKNSKTEKVTKVDTTGEAASIGIIGVTDENFSFKELIDDNQIYFDRDSMSLKKEFLKDDKNLARAYSMLGMYEKENGENLFSTVKIEVREKSFTKGVLTLDVSTISSVREMQEVNYKIGLVDADGKEIKIFDVSSKSKDFTNKIDKTVETYGLDGYNEINVKILGGEIKDKDKNSMSIEPLTDLKIKR